MPARGSSGSEEASHDHSKNIKLRLYTNQTYRSLSQSGTIRKGGKATLKLKTQKTGSMSMSMRLPPRHGIKAAQLAPDCVPRGWNRDMPGLYETSEARVSRMLKVALEDLMELA